MNEVVEHHASASIEAHAMLIEPHGTLDTGGLDRGDCRVDVMSRLGESLDEYTTDSGVFSVIPNETWDSAHP